LSAINIQPWQAAQMGCPRSKVMVKAYNEIPAVKGLITGTSNDNAFSLTYLFLYIM
jgi:hypothetical protein